MPDAWWRKPRESGQGRDACVFANVCRAAAERAGTYRPKIAVVVPRWTAHDHRSPGGASKGASIERTPPPRRPRVVSVRAPRLGGPAGRGRRAGRTAGSAAGARRRQRPLRATASRRPTSWARSVAGNWRRGSTPRRSSSACSDSRVPPEYVFDQQLGQVFVVRTAGNVADGVALGSIEYAVEHLGIPLIVVLGHRSCGAVTAALEAHRTHAHPHGNVARGPEARDAGRAAGRAGQGPRPAQRLD